MTDQFHSQYESDSFDFEELNLQNIVTNVETDVMCMGCCLAWYCCNAEFIL